MNDDLNPTKVFLMFREFFPIISINSTELLKAYMPTFRNSLTKSVEVKFVWQISYPPANGVS